MIYLNIIMIAICCVVIIDLTDFIDTISSKIHSLLSNGRSDTPFYIKPFSCSLCMSFWCNLIYILIIKEFSILILMYILLIAYATPIIKGLILTINNLIIKIIEKLNEKL